MASSYPSKDVQQMPLYISLKQLLDETVEEIPADIDNTSLEDYAELTGYNFRGIDSETEI